MPEIHGVMDIEALSTEDNAVVPAIGVVIFDPTAMPGTYIDQMELHIDIDQKGRHIDPDTLKWWMKDDKEDAFKATFKAENIMKLGPAMKKLDEFLRKYSHMKQFWGCAPDFDMRIVQNIYKQFKVSFPIKHWNFADIRTLEKFVWGKSTRKPGGINYLDGNAHEALHDCLMEAYLVQHANQILKERLVIHRAK